MKGPLRKTMTWLHTWSSILLGWLLFAIFLTGTLSYFRGEISHWMTPEQHASYVTDDTIMKAYERLSEVAPDANSWSISLPTVRDNTVGLSWQNEGENQRRRGPQETMNAATGESIDGRETRGGDFLYRFHFELYGMPRGFARTVVEIATMAMFIAILSGIVMHRKIFSDFFMMRTKNRSLGWADAHAVTAVLALPFHIMITFSGLLLLSSSLIFWTENTRGGGGGGGERNQAQNAQQQMAENGPRGGQGDLATLTANRTEGGRMTEQRTQGMNGARGQDGARAGADTSEVRARPNRDVRETEGERLGERRTRGEGRQTARHQGRQDIATPPLRNMLTQAESLFAGDIGRVQIQNPLTADATFVFSPVNRDMLMVERGSNNSVTFSATGLEIERNQAKASENNSFFSAAGGVLHTLHEARFADAITRWAFFLAGVMGTIMVGTGSVLWAVKRAKRQMGQFGYELVVITNIASIAGLCGAVAVYFWLNRLLPATLENRTNWEINGFFVAWLLSLLHAIFYRNKGAWVVQLGIAGALFCLIPVLDTLTSSASLLHAIIHVDVLRLSFDVMCLLLGGIMLATARYLQNKARRVISPKPATRKPTLEGAVK